MKKIAIWIAAVFVLVACDKIEINKEEGIAMSSDNIY